MLSTKMRTISHFFDINKTVNGNYFMSWRCMKKMFFLFRPRIWISSEAEIQKWSDA